jgi:predicted small lipoprotein YifL
VIRALAALLAIGLLAGACGKVGPIRPPGPQEQVSYPRTYPAR